MATSASVANGVNWLKPGFTNDSVTNYLFKKSLHHVDTGVGQPYYREAIAKPTTFRDYFATDKIPADPPADFSILSTEQIKTQFGVSDLEISTFQTKLGESNAFSIERSASYPHLYRINNLKLTPHPSNPYGAFRTFTVGSRVNLLTTTIPFTYGNGGYRGAFNRTDGEGGLSDSGRDLIFSQQVAYVYDFDVGVFTLHDDDNKTASPNPVGVLKPPAITCYIYRGSFGRLGWSYLEPDSLVLDEKRLLVGRRDISDPTFVMDVSGSAFITDIYAHSYNTISDMRLKTNIRNIEIARDLLHIQPRTYNYVSDTTAPPEFGVLAQEVEAIMPELVRTNADGFKSVMYDRFGVALLPLVKAQASRIEALEKENTEIKEMLKIIVNKLKI